MEKVMNADISANISANTNATAVTRVTRFARVAALPLAVVVAFVLFGVWQERVWSLANIRNIVIQASYLSIFAMAQTAVIITRGFDLSLGYAVSLVSVVAAMAMVAVVDGVGSDAAALWLGILAGLLLASAIGFVNGALVAGIGINPLVTTLGMAYILMTLATTASDGFPVTELPASLNRFLAQGDLAGVPVPVVVAAVVFAALSVTLRATRLGRSMTLIGANPRAAVATGIRLFPVLTLAYALCGLLIGIGALMLTARTGSGEPNLGGNLTLESIAAAVVGGVRLAGGEGGAGAAVLGALFVTVLANGMNLARIDGYLQQICLGVIIIASLIIGRDSSARA